MRSKLLLAVVLALSSLSIFGAVGALPLLPGGIEVQGRLLPRGTLRVTVLMAPMEPSQPCLHAVRLTALPSGTPLVIFVAAGAPMTVAEAAFETVGAVLQAPLDQEPLSVQTTAPAAGDNRIRVEYITQAPTGELTTQTVGEAQFETLDLFHFLFEPALGGRMISNSCGFCGDNRCGCSSCSEVFICCPACSVRCEPGTC